MPAKVKLTWEQWMREVNRYVEALVGLSADDLQDQCYKDWFEDGVSPSAAARRAIRYAKGSGDLF